MKSIAAYKVKIIKKSAVRQDGASVCQKTSKIPPFLV